MRELNKAISDTEVQLGGEKGDLHGFPSGRRKPRGHAGSLSRSTARIAEKDDEKQPPAPGRSKTRGSRRASAYVTAQMSDMDGIADPDAKPVEGARNGTGNPSMKELDQINAQINSFQSRLESGPANEQHYLQLMSDQQQANQAYQD